MTPQKGRDTFNRGGVPRRAPFGQLVLGELKARWAGRAVFRRWRSSVFLRQSANFEFLAGFEGRRQVESAFGLFLAKALMGATDMVIS